MSDNDTILLYSQKLWPEFTINKSLLEHPTSEFVMDFYIRFASSIRASVIRSTGSEEYIQPEENYTPTVTVRLINDYLHNLELGDGCEVTLADLYTPTAKRTKFRFKCLLHLLTYYHEREEIIREKVLEVEESQLQLERKRQEKKKAKENLGKLAEEVSRLANHKDKLRKEFKQSQKMYENMQKLEKEVQIQLTKSRQDLMKLVTTCENKQTLLDNLKSSVESLTAEIVPEDDYQSLNNLLTNLIKKSAELDADAEALNGSLEIKVTEIKRFRSINEELKELVNLTTKLESSQNSVVPREKQVREIQNYLNIITGKLTELNDDIIKLQANTNNLKEQLKSAIARNNNFVKNNQVKIEELNSNLNEEVLFQNKVASTKDELNSSIKMLSNEFSRIRSECEQLQVTDTNNYKTVLGNFNSVISNFHKTLEKFSDKTKH